MLVWANIRTKITLQKIGWEARLPKHDTIIVGRLLIMSTRLMTY